jgi:methylated-DNA-[protein]-cysteine S-methyltransferase
MMSTTVTSAVVPVTITRHPTPVGTLTLAVSDEAVLCCSFAAPEAVQIRLAGCGGVGAAQSTDRQLALLARTRAELDAYLDGRLRAFSLPVDLRAASPFVRDTVAALGGFVAYGSTGTYGALARRMGRPGAARAVGRALGANPVCVIAPCHRVVASSGGLIGYAGGTAAKRHLLDLESGART